jgi:MFS family permease
VPNMGAVSRRPDRGSKLSSPLTTRGVTLPNRIVASPMCQYCAEDGKATSWRLAHPGQLALSRAGLLCIESTSVEPAGHTLWTSAAPAMTYGLYAREWHLTNTVTAGTFAIDPLAVVVMLVGFGGISDQIGHRATMLAGLFASLVGALLFAVAPNVCWVFAGRALMGIGVGLAASPSTAAILEFTSRNT